MNVQAEQVIPGKESKCNIAAKVLHQRREQCGRELDSVSRSRVLGQLIRESVLLVRYVYCISPHEALRRNS